MRKNQSFDNLQDNYETEIDRAIQGFPGEHDFFLRAKAKIIESMANGLNKTKHHVRLLDIGCGLGLMERHLRIPNAEITGIDVSEPLLEKARINVPGCRFYPFDGQRINDEDNSYHLVFAINVFHHVSINSRFALISEMKRVLRPGGVLAIFEHNKYHPATRYVVSQCAFDRDAILLSQANTRSLLQKASLNSIESSYIIFIPWSIRMNRVLEYALGKLPLGAQYFVKGLK